MNEHFNITAAWMDTIFAHAWAMLAVVCFSQWHWLCGLACVIVSVVMASA